MSAEAHIYRHVGERLEATADFTRNGRRMLAVCDAAPALLAQLEALERKAREVGTVVRAAAKRIDQGES